MPSLPFNIYSVIVYLFMDFRFLFYSKCWHCYYSYFDTQIILYLFSGSLFSVAAVSFWHTYIVLWAHSYSKTKWFPAHLVFPCPSLGVSHFFKEPWFILVKNYIYEPRPMCYCAHFKWSITIYWLVCGESWEIYIYTHVCIFTHTHICVCVYIYIHIQTHTYVSILISTYI